MIFNPNVMAAAGGGGGAAVGHYVGDGNPKRILTFDFDPAIVLIYGPSSEVVAVYPSSNAFSSNDDQINVSWNSKSLILSSTNSYSAQAFNYKNNVFYWAAIPKA